MSHNPDIHDPCVLWSTPFRVFLSKSHEQRLVVYCFLQYGYNATYSWIVTLNAEQTTGNTISFLFFISFRKCVLKSSFWLFLQFLIALSSFFLFSRYYGLQDRPPFRSGSYYASEISFLASPLLPLDYIRGSYVFYLALFFLF